MNNHTRHHHGEHHIGHGFHRRHEDENARPEESERHHGRGGWDGHRGGGSGRGHFGGHHSAEEGRGAGRGGRARRGEARHILLDALRDGPKHGYEIIKSLEERSGGHYSPSPGTVYPTMQLLEDLGFVRADKDAERRVFSLTEDGTADLEAHTQEIADFWARFAAGAIGGQPEMGYVREEMESLARTVWEGLRGSGSAASPEITKNVRLALERCRSEIREIITGAATSKT